MIKGLSLDRARLKECKRYSTKSKVPSNTLLHHQLSKIHQTSLDLLKLKNQTGEPWWMHPTLDMSRSGGSLCSIIKVQKFVPLLEKTFMCLIIIYQSTSTSYTRKFLIRQNSKKICLPMGNMAWSLWRIFLDKERYFHHAQNCVWAFSFHSPFSKKAWQPGFYSLFNSWLLG